MFAIHVTSFADAQQHVLAAAGVLPGHQTEPCRKLPAAPEALCVADRCDERARGKWPDAGDAREPSTHFVTAVPGLNLRLELPDLPVKFLQMVHEALDEQSKRASKFVLRVFDQFGYLTLEIPDSLGNNDPEFRE
jgi:hypothetical protein